MRYFQGSARLRPRRLLAASAAVATAVLLLAATGCGSSGSSASGADAKTIKVGLDSVLSGPNTSNGELTNGTVAYLKYINAMGGVNGYTFTWQTADTMSTTAGAYAATTKLIAANVNAIIGIGTVAIVAVRPKAASYKIPIMLAGDGSNFVPPIKNFFDFAPNFYSVYAGAYRLARQVDGNTPVGLVYENDAIGIPATKAIPAYAASAGLPNPSASVAVDQTTTDCTPYAGQLQSSGAKAVVLAASTDVAACVVKAANAIGYSPKWVGDWGLNSASYEEELGSLFPGQYVIDYQTPVTGSSAAAALFNEQMEKYDPKDLKSSYSEQGWDAGAIFVDAVRKATANSQAYSNDAVVNALDTEFTGQPLGLLAGGVVYDDSQHYGVLSAGVFQTVPGGGEKQISPFTKLPEPYGAP